MTTQSALAQMPAAGAARDAESDANTRRGDDPLDVVGAPTITLYVSDGQADESEAAFHALETVGLAFAVAPAGDRQVQAEWGGRAFGGASGVERLAATLRTFRDDLARLNSPGEDPHLKEQAASRYRQQLDSAREQFNAILRAPHD